MVIGCETVICVLGGIEPSSFGVWGLSYYAIGLGSPGIICGGRLRRSFILTGVGSFRFGEWIEKGEIVGCFADVFIWAIG